MSHDRQPPPPSARRGKASYRRAAVPPWLLVVAAALLVASGAVIAVLAGWLTRGSGDSAAAPAHGSEAARSADGDPAADGDWTALHDEWQRAPMDRSLDLGDELEPRGELERRSLLSGLAVLDGLRHAVVLDLSESEVLKIDLKDLDVVERRSIPDLIDLSVSPGGRTVYVAARATVGAQESTAIHRLDDDLSDVDVVTIPQIVSHVASDDNGLVFASLPNRSDGLAVSMAERRVVAEASRLPAQAPLRFHPSGNRLYALGTGFLVCVHKVLQQDGKLETYDNNRRLHKGTLGTDFAISPDGRFLFESGGSILRLGATEISDLAYVATLPPFTGIAFSRRHSVFFVALADGTVSAYSMDDFSTPLRTYQTGHLLRDLILDTRREQLVGVATPPVHGYSPRSSEWRHRQAGSLVAFSFD